MMVQAFMNIIVSMDNSCIKYDQRLFLGREKMRWTFILPTELKPTSGYQKKKKKANFISHTRQDITEKAEEYTQAK